jgi:hypothetical protein
MKITLALVIGAAVSLNTSFAQWVRIGNIPTTYVRSFLVCDGSVLYAGTDDGVFHSTDDGVTWNPANAGMTDSSVGGMGAIGRIIFAGTVRGNVYSGTTDGGAWVLSGWQGSSPVNAVATMGGDVYIGISGSSVQKSIDYGTTWGSAGTGLPPFCYSLTVCDTTIFARVNSPGLQVSTDRGGSWTMIADGLTPTGAAALMGGRIYIGTTTDVQLSTDNGANWIPSRVGLPNKPVRALLTMGTNLLAAVDTSGVYLSADGGANWIARNEGLSDPPVKGLGFNDSSLYIFGASIWRRPFTELLPPSIPLVRAPTNQTINSFNANWDLSTYTVVYQIDVSSDIDFMTFLSGYHNQNVAGPPVSVVGLTPGTQYFYRVRALNYAEMSGNSASMEAWTVPFPPVLKPPTAVRSDGFTLNWSTSTGAVAYRLDVANDAGYTSFVPNYQDFDVGADTSHAMGGLSASTTYYFRIRAVNSGGTSANSTGEVLTTPQVPLLTPATSVRSTSFTVNWNVSFGALEYRLDVSPNSGFSPFVSGYDNKQVGSDSSCVVVGLSSNTTYYFRVRALNLGGSSAYSSPSTQLTAPAPPTANGPGSITSNSFTASWSSPPGATGYRLDVATDSLFTSFVSGYNNRSVSGTSQQVTGLAGGVKYFYRVRAENGSLTGDNSNTIPVITLANYPGTYTLSCTTPYPTHASLTDYVSADYHLIGLPGNSGLDIGDFLQGAWRTDWQIYWDNGQITTPKDYYVEYQAQNSTFSCTAGKAFWLLSKGNWVLSRQVPTAALDGNGEVRIPLPQGRTWHLIANPFNADILWAGVTATNGIKDSISTWDGQKLTRSSVFQPYKGYLFFNDSSRTYLRIPYALTAGKPALKTQTAGEGWRVFVAVRSGEYSDETTALGVAPGAGADLDVLDQRKPRHFAGIPEAYFDRPEWDATFREFATDIRPAVGELQVWDFKVRSDERKSVSLEFAGIADVPANFAVQLIDMDGARAIDLREESKYLLRPAAKISALEVLIGSSEAVKKMVEQIVPRDFALLQNYPNPFNPTTIIPVVLPQKSTIVLNVYNDLGQLVKTLFEGEATAGKFYVDWDGSDMSGRKVASGIYFCHMVADGKVTRTLKMALLK